MYGCDSEPIAQVKTLPTLIKESLFYTIYHCFSNKRDNMYKMFMKVLAKFVYHYVRVVPITVCKTRAVSPACAECVVGVSLLLGMPGHSQSAGVHYTASVGSNKLTVIL